MKNIIQIQKWLVRRKWMAVINSETRIELVSG